MAKAFKFRLQTVLDVRLLTKDRLVQELAEAERAIVVEREALAQLNDSYTKSQDELREHQQGVVDLQTIQWFQNYLVALSGRITDQERRVQDAEAARDEKRIELMKAAQEVEVLEKLKSNAYQAYLKAEDKAEAALIDELATGRHVRREGSL